MKLSGRLVFLILCLNLVGFSTLAQENEAKQKIIFKKNESHRFEGLKLKGQFKKPELSYIYQRKGIRSEQIIDVPDNFNNEIREDSEKF